MASSSIPRSGLAPVNGIELAYQIHGGGKPLDPPNRLSERPPRRTTSRTGLQARPRLQF